MGIIAHYEMNENTANDNDELVTNGSFTGWSGDNPDDWTVIGESTPNREVSQVGTGEGHGGVGTGYCNIYTDSSTAIRIQQVLATSLIVGRKYRFSMNLEKTVSGHIYIKDGAHEVFDWFYPTSDAGIKTFTFVAAYTDLTLLIFRKDEGGVTDVTIDDVSIKLLAVKDSYFNDHDGLAVQDTSVIHRAGRTNGAFDFTPNDYIIIPDHADFTPALTPFSISAWVYMHDSSGFWIASKGVYNTDAEYAFDIHTTLGFRFVMRDESVDSCEIGRKYTGNMSVYENVWTHLVGTYSGSDKSSDLKLYINSKRVDDGDEDHSPELFEAVENLGHDVWIGRYSATYANGLIDNVMFFNHELSPVEVEILHSGTEVITDLDRNASPRRCDAAYMPLRQRYEF